MRIIKSSREVSDDEIHHILDQLMEGSADGESTGVWELKVPDKDGRISFDWTPSTIWYNVESPFSTTNHILTNNPSLDQPMKSLNEDLTDSTDEFQGSSTEDYFWTPTSISTTTTTTKSLAEDMDFMDDWEKTFGKQQLKQIENFQNTILENNMDDADLMDDWEKEFQEQLMEQIKNAQKTMLENINRRICLEMGSCETTKLTTTTTTITTTTTALTTTTYMSTTTANSTKEMSTNEIEEVQTPVITSISVVAVMILLVIVSLMIYFCLFKKACRKLPCSFTKRTNEFESISMVEIEDNPRITESMASIPNTSSLENLWKRIKEDDNYQPTYSSTTSAPLAAVLNK